MKTNHKIMKSVKNSLLIIIGVLILNSCFKDDSKEFTLINSINIDITGIPESFNVKRYDSISITPLVYKNGLSDENLSFRWQIIGGDVERDLGDKLNLKAEITEVVMTNPYKLILTVTDNKAGLEEYMVWPVTVRTEIGAGLIVSDTRDDGVTSDLTLIMSYDFTSNYSGDTKIYHNLFSNSNNGERINGVVNDIHTINAYNERSITVLSSKDILHMDPYDYVCTRKNNDLFYVKFKDDEPILPTSVAFNYGRPTQYIALSGNVFARSVDGPRSNYNFQATIAFPNLPITTNYNIKKICAAWGNSTNNTIGYGFDEQSGCFIGIRASVYALQYLSSGMGAFDLNNIRNSKCLYLGMGYIGSTARPMYAILKDTIENKNYLYHLEQNVSIASAGYNAKIAAAKYDLTAINCPEIKDAKFFASNMNDNSFFYATENKVYSMLISLDIRINSLPQYVCKAGEVITEMKLWTSASAGAVAVGGMVKDAGGRRRFDSQGRLLLVCTYNESTNEGKVIAIPVETINSGFLDQEPSSYRIFGGFGKIVNLSPQII